MLDTGHFAGWLCPAHVEMTVAELEERTEPGDFHAQHDLSDPAVAMRIATRNVLAQDRAAADLSLTEDEMIEHVAGLNDWLLALFYNDETGFFHV